MNPNLAIEKLRALEEKLSNHPLCLNWEEYGAGYFVVLPDGYKFDAVRAIAGKTKTQNINLILNKLEEIWKDSLL